MAEQTMRLVRYEAARAALAEAHRVDEVKDIRDKALAIAAYAKQANDTAMVEWATEIKVRAERRAGELLAVMDKNTGARGFGKSAIVRDDSTPPTLPELGISLDQSSRWQKLAAVPAEQFEKAVEAAKEVAREVTTTSVLKQAAMAVHYTSDSPEWYTPKSIIEATLAVLGGIDLDPCSNDATNPNIPAKRHFTARDNGLVQAWSGRVYMNPPYGDEIGQWTEKLRREHELENVGAAIALVPARTDTRWFTALRNYPRCFVQGRLKFSESANSAPFPSAVFYLGKDVARFAQAFASLGDTFARVEDAA